MTQACSWAVRLRDVDDDEDRRQPASRGADGDVVMPGHESPLPTDEYHCPGGGGKPPLPAATRVELGLPLD